MFAIGKLLWLVWFLLAPPSVDDLPPIELTRPDFYRAIADRSRIEIRWELSDSTIRSDGELSLTLAMQSIANPDEVQCPDLARLFPEFAKVVQLLPVERTQLANEVRFRWPLRPRLRTGTIRIPSLKFVYYRLDFPEELRFQTTYTRPVEFQVEAAAVVTAPPLPIDAPEEFLTIRPVSPAPFWADFRWTWLPILGSLLLGPLLWQVWLWRFPDAARLARIKQNRAARQAWATFEKVESNPDGFAVIWQAMLQYLQVRHGVPESAQTPAEIAVQLENQSPALALAWQNFTDRLQLARFASSDDTPLALAKAAQEVLLKWEEEQGEVKPLLSGLFCLLAFSLANGIALPTDAESAFREGVLRRSDAEAARPYFRQAAQLWSQEPVSISQATNAARAWFLAGDLPHAIQSAHSGLALAPWDATLQRDMRTLRSRVDYPRAEPKLLPPELVGWQHRLSPTDVGMASIFGSLVVFAVLAWLFIRQHPWRWVGVVLMIFGLLLTGSLTFRLGQPSPVCVAVVAQPAYLLSGNGPSFEPRRSKPLPRGAEVRYRHQRGGWVQVELFDGTIGWLPENSVLLPGSPSLLGVHR